ncbi:competence protein ComEA [Methylomonas lenta]|uniref:Competence protein ComEA n=1 Tax=Methylomonas lenta TaxID=980561 RepID=A0A177MZS0_9GAMM|nr:helix-hairpin-helix domain-containing protein [Methylomonas lenta]OAI11218.1 competence protein ComEA [Methylomonas lenta]
MIKIFIFLSLLSASVFADPVNINTEDAETISNALTGVGPKKADAIVQYRKEHGLFKSLEELENVPGIGEKIIKANEKDILITGESAVKSDTAEKDVAKSKQEKIEKKAD